MPARLARQGENVVANLNTNEAKVTARDIILAGNMTQDPELKKECCGLLLEGFQEALERERDEHPKRSRRLDIMTNAFWFLCMAALMIAVAQLIKVFL